ncbi:signal transducer and transcription activator-like, partial [Contarinia nasturtii]|uniref:signal transducer and transcription activator-like n=1 Tax=Contarinia nasturtii TaxID=265458 RepID=UPI0012D3889B
DKAIRENIIRGDNFYWEASCSKANKVNFMFWDWYYGAMKFIKDNIKNLWEEGLVEGFASNAFLEEQFPNYPIGTFLLRFSESTVGVLILMWVGEIEVVQVPLNSSEEFMMKNRTSNNLKESVIVNIIQDLKQCTQLCDGTPKDKAFKSFATTPSDKKSSDKITEKYKFLKIIHAVNNSSTSDENTAIAVSNSLNLNSPMPNNIYGSSMQGNIYSSPLPNNIYGSPVQSTTSGSNSPGSSMYARFTNQSPALPESHNDTTGMIWDPSSVDNYFFSNTEINNLTSILEDYEMTTPIQVDVINSLQSSVPSTPSPIVDPTPVPKFVDTFGNICNFKCSFN